MTNRSIKEDRLYIRASSEQKAKLDRAAASRNSTRSQWVLQTALEEADRILAERTHFELGPDEWSAFTAALDSPAKDLTAIKALVKEPSPFHA